MEKEKSTSTVSLIKTLGPGLLFASSAIGTSHLVLSTRAGAHHGMIFFWIILITLILKYPMYEFGPRYAHATGFSLVKAYRDQGTWAVYLFMGVVFISMFAVTGAIGAVSAGLLSTIFSIQGLSIQWMTGMVLGLTMILLLAGGYKALDGLIKLITVVLLFTVVAAFAGVLIKGPVDGIPDFRGPSLLKGAGLTLLISLIGWMPAGMEASAMNSIWVIEKTRTSGHLPDLRTGLMDFKLGYAFTLILALMFMTIGAFTVYGSGDLLEGNATQFSQKLLSVFTAHLGSWAYPIMAVAAFGTIYGTLATVMDAFPRCFVRGLRVLRFEHIDLSVDQEAYLARWYRIWVVLLGLGGFLLFFFSATSMISLLEVATIASFLLSPIIGFLNLRAIQSPSVLPAYKPPAWMIVLAYAGLWSMVVFAVYYLFYLIA